MALFVLGLEAMTLGRPRSMLFLPPTDGGFTLVDLLIGLAIILIVGGTAITAMIELNRQAEIHRLYSCASTLLENQMKEAMNDSPYVPQGTVSGTSNTGPEVPASLTSTTQAMGVTNGYYDSSEIPVSGTLSMSITEPATLTGTTGLNIALVTGTFTFSYRSKLYSVMATTYRASDL